MWDFTENTISGDTTLYAKWEQYFLKYRTQVPPDAPVAVDTSDPCCGGTCIANERYGTGYYQLVFSTPPSFIQPYFFKDITRLTRIIQIPETITAIMAYAFEGCTSLSSVDFGNVNVIYHNAFYGCSSLSSIELVNVRNISDWAFHGCTSLSSITISNRIENIGYGVFGDCPAESIRYLGSKAGWNNVTKDSDWAKWSSITAIICNDGTINLTS